MASPLPIPLGIDQGPNSLVEIILRLMPATPDPTPQS
jgi:hypothetical protein